MTIPHEAVAVRQAEERLAEIFGVSKPAEGIHVVEGSGDGRQWEAGEALRRRFFARGGEGKAGKLRGKGRGTAGSEGAGPE